MAVSQVRGGFPGKSLSASVLDSEAELKRKYGAQAIAKNVMALQDAGAAGAFGSMQLRCTPLCTRDVSASDGQPTIKNKFRVFPHRKK
eukprot:5598760-Pyramimonas_sp.AAC.1